jgi:hypothetical protein
MNATRWTLTGLGLLAAGACGGRPSYWDSHVDSAAPTFGLTKGVAIVDEAQHRVVVLTAAPNQQIAKQSTPVGHHFASAVNSPDGTKLFLLSSGDWPRQSASDEWPSLTVLSLDGFTATATRFTMSVPLANLALDPLGNFAVAYQGSGSTASFAQNPNEIVVFDLTRPPNSTLSGAPFDKNRSANPVTLSIQSFGGTPQRLTFTPPMSLPVGAPTGSPRQLLLIETDIDVSIVDLSHAFESPPKSALTVRLTSGVNAQTVVPAGLVVNPDDGRIALRTSSNSNVYLLQLVMATDPNAANDFNATITSADVGGIPSDIQFVRTMQGLRIAALVPSKSTAMLVPPDNSPPTPVALSSAYSNLSLVTSVVRGPVPSTDVALLWAQGSGVASGVALWTLSGAIGKPYQSVEVLQVTEPIASVIAVPAPNDHLRVLETSNGGGGNDFFVLDLVKRTANKLRTTSSSKLVPSPDGARLWAYASGGTDLAQFDLGTLAPTPLTTTLPISSVFDVQSSSGGPCGSLIALHARATFGATVFDACVPDPAKSRLSTALLLEEP